MGHKIKYGAKFFLKIKYFPYLPTHFFGGHVTGNQHIIYFGLIADLPYTVVHYLRVHSNNRIVSHVRELLSVRVVCMPTFELAKLYCARPASYRWKRWHRSGVGKTFVLS